MDMKEFHDNLIIINENFEEIVEPLSTIQTLQLLKLINVLRTKLENESLQFRINRMNAEDY